MKSKDSTKKGNRNRQDDLFHLSVITLVILTSIIGWGVQTVSARDFGSSVTNFLDALNSVSRQAIVKAQVPQETQTFSHNYPPKLVCLNSVNSATLESLPVFGPVLSGRTIIYREALGGFVRFSQLQEVYGLDSSGYDMVKDRFFVDDGLVNKLCLNTAPWIDLKRHPYIGHDGARARRFH